MISSFVDTVLEVPIVSSFSRIGYDIRRRTDDWSDLASYDLTGRVVALTGGTSGIGLAAARRFAAAGATLVITGRRAEKNEVVVRELTETSGNSQVSHVAADMGDLDQVRALADELRTAHGRLDVLVHNAGALSAERRESAAGIEATVASQVVGPFLLTSLLLDRLRDTGDARVITMSSGGMYTAGLTVSKLEMNGDDYNGTEQYARAKRAQVTLNELWAERHPSTAIRFHAMHPGWAATPGVDDALPGFAKVMGPILRTPDQGADTLVWLAADDEALESSGAFWLDRRLRSIHKLPATRRTDTTERREALWAWVAAAAGVDPDTTS